MTEGTPKTLAEAIHMSLCIGPMDSVAERLESQIADFIRNKIATPMLKADDKTADVLKQLCDELTKKKS